MAFKHGRKAAVWYQGLNLSPYLTSAELAATGDVSDVSTFGDDWRRQLAGLLGATLSAEGWFDPALTALDTELGAGATLITYCPGGAAAVGDPARMLSVIDTAYGRSNNTDGPVAFSLEALADAYVAIGFVLHPLGEDTNTTTGASRDGAAASATGWTAQLHVTAVDAGSWVVKLQDSADNSSWSDVSGGAFAAKTAAGAEQIRSAGATTALRRYVRYVATRTGGTTGDGITFGLSISRTNQS